MQYACKKDLQAHTLSGGSTMRHSPGYRRSKSKHALADGIIPLAEDTRPEANRIVSSCQYTLQQHGRQGYEINLSVSMLGEYRLAVDKISDAVPNRQMKS